MERPQGQCPVCREVYTLRPGGLVVDHWHGSIPPGGEAGMCPGSGQPALPANAKETR